MACEKAVQELDKADTSLNQNGKLSVASGFDYLEHFTQKTLYTFQRHYKPKYQVFFIGLNFKL